MLRINKTKAMGLYNNGSSIFIVPCNINPNNVQGFGCTINKSCGKEFKTLVDEFEYYNCNSETGTYCAYYV